MRLIPKNNRSPFNNFTAVINHNTTFPCIAKKKKKNFSLQKKGHPQINNWMLLLMFADKMFIPLWCLDLFNFGRTTRVPSWHPNWVPCGLNKSGLVILNCFSSLAEYTFTSFIWGYETGAQTEPIWCCWSRRHFGSVLSYWTYLKAWLKRKKM